MGLELAWWAVCLDYWMPHTLFRFFLDLFREVLLTFSRGVPGSDRLTQGAKNITVTHNMLPALHPDTQCLEPFSGEMEKALFHVHPPPYALPLPINHGKHKSKLFYIRLEGVEQGRSGGILWCVEVVLCRICKLSLFLLRLPPSAQELPVTPVVILYLINQEFI